MVGGGTAAIVAAVGVLWGAAERAGNWLQEQVQVHGGGGDCGFAKDACWVGWV